MTLLQHHLLALGITSAMTLGFSLFALLKNPRRNLNRAVALYCLSLAWWSGWECAAFQMPTQELTFQLFRIEYLGVVFIPTLLCALVAYLLDFSPQKRRRFLAPMYLLSVAALFPSAIFPGPYFLSITNSTPVAYLPSYPWAGTYYWIFLVFFIGSVSVAHVLIIRRWKKAQGEERTRLALFLIGSLAAYVGGCPEFALKYGVRLGWLSPFGLYGIPFYISVLIYSVIRHRFLDIQIVIRRSLVYSILVTLMTVGYFGLVYSAEKMFQITLGYKSPWFSLGAFALMALLFHPLKIAVQRLVDLVVFRAPQEHLAKKLERLEEQALQAEKFKAVSTLAAGMAHEIKNPLTTLKTFTEFIPEKQHDPAFLQKLHEVYTTEINRIQDIVKDLLEFSKPRPPELKPVDVGPLIASTVNLLSGDLLRRRVQWSVDCQHNGTAIHADVSQLRQVLINLIQNAADAMPNDGELKISTQAVNNHLELTVSDTGSGIPPALLPKIFDPFVTTKPNGNGLGLAMVYSILQAHRGSIRADSQPGRGTTFTVSLPL